MADAKLSALPVGAAIGDADLWYSDQAATSVSQASTAISIYVNGKLPVATNVALGICRPDNATITVAAGVLTAAAGGAPGAPAASYQYNDGAGGFAGSANFTQIGGDPNVASGRAYLYNALNLAYLVEVDAVRTHDNVFIGEAGNFLVTGIQNFASGTDALKVITAGSANMAIGSEACVAVTTGSANVAVGGAALFSVTTHGNNVGIGTNAGRNVDTDNNVLIGDQAGINLTTGGTATFIGSAAGVSASTGFGNTIIGYNCGAGVTTGQNNTIIGANIAAGGNPSGTIIFGDGLGNVWLDYNYTNAFLVSTAANIGMKTGTFTIAGGLPAYLQIDGARIFVTDALAPVFAAPVVGGGTIHCPVYWDALRAAWCCG